MAVVPDAPELDAESEAEDETQSDASSAPATPVKDQKEASLLREILDGQRVLADRLAKVESSPPALPRPPQRVEEDDARVAEVSPEVTALADFVADRRPSGAVSQTAHRMRGGEPPTTSAEELMKAVEEWSSTHSAQTRGAPP